MATRAPNYYLDRLLTYQWKWNSHKSNITRSANGLNPCLCTYNGIFTKGYVKVNFDSFVYSGIYSLLRPKTLDQIVPRNPWCMTKLRLAAPFLWTWSAESETHIHDDVIKWKHFPRCWSFVQGIHRSPVNSPHKGQWRGALMFSLIAGDLRRHRAHYDVIVMFLNFLTYLYLNTYVFKDRKYHFVNLVSTFRWLLRQLCGQYLYLSLI